MGQIDLAGKFAPHFCCKRDNMSVLRPCLRSVLSYKNIIPSVSVSGFHRTATQ